MVVPDESLSSRGLRMLSNDSSSSYKEQELCAEIIHMDAGLREETKDKS